MIQKVRNWKEYNKALKKRGAIIFSFDEKYLKELYYSGKQERGGAREYSAKMYEYLLTIKVMLRLPWRATIGFAEGIFDSTGVNVYTTSGWHQRKYGKDALCRKREQWKKIHIALDLNTMQIISVAYTHLLEGRNILVKNLNFN